MKELKELRPDITKKELSKEEIQGYLGELNYIKDAEIEEQLIKLNSKITYSDISHAYLHLSKVIFKIISGKETYKLWKWIRIRSNEKLRDAYNQILRVLVLISVKHPDNDPDREKSTPNLLQNKALTFDALNHYASFMTSKESRLFNALTLLISAIAVSISLWKHC